MPTSRIDEHDDRWRTVLDRDAAADDRLARDVRCRVRHALLERERLEHGQRNIG